MPEQIKQPERIFSVSEFLEAINIALDRFPAKVVGEVTEIKEKRHLYFSIKDKEDGSVLNCICWQGNYRLSGVALEEGLEVVLSGKANIYKPSGRFSFIAETIALKGEGALKKAYEALKKKLAQDGLFTEERKRPLPDFPEKIGVITSREGAVLNDLLSNLGQFGFKIKLINSRVQGAEAIKDLLGAVETFSKTDIEVLLLMRGGGSLEDLQAFNNENLVRAIVDFQKPVIAAIGHHKDEPLLALAADAACSTPTAAANLLNKSWERAPLQIQTAERLILEKFSRRIFQLNRLLWQVFSRASGNLTGIFKQYQQIEQALINNLLKLAQQLKDDKELIKESGQEAVSQFKNWLQQAVQQLYFISKTIQANNPEKNLGLGYCLLRKKGSIIKSVRQVNKGEQVEAQLKDGRLTSIIEKISLGQT